MQAERPLDPPDAGDVFSVLFGLLVYWLLGFVVRDIGTWPGPDFALVEKQLIDQQLVDRVRSGP